MECVKTSVLPVSNGPVETQHENSSRREDTEDKSAVERWIMRIENQPLLTGLEQKLRLLAGTCSREDPQRSRCSDVQAEGRAGG